MEFTNMKRLLKTKLGFYYTLTLVSLFLIIPILSFAFPNDHAFPRTTAWQLNTGKSKPAELAKFDTVILNMNAHQTHPELIKEIRRINPDTVILAYTSAVEYPLYRLNDVEPAGRGVWHDLGEGIDQNWFLKKTDGSYVSFWEQHVSMNLTAKDNKGQTYAQYLSDFLYRNVLLSGYWDGLFFDTTWDGISGIPQVNGADMNGDRIADSPTQLDALWHQGQDRFFNLLRQKIGDNYLIITNGAGQFEYVNNGRMFESFPEYWEGGWSGSISRYLYTDSTGNFPRLNIINSDTDNTGNFTNYTRMRYGLTSTLMANGYYNFDYGTSDRSYIPYYDEYDTSLGRPVSAAYHLTDPLDDTIVDGLWQRDFENGISIVNSSDKTRDIILSGDFEKIHGRQDPYVNSGQVVSRVIVPAYDGVILLRPLQEVLGNDYENGSYARVFTADAKVIRSSFFSYDKRFEGSDIVLKDDFDSNGTIETMVSKEGKITIYENNGAKRAEFYPFGSTYRKTVEVAIGDLNGDGTVEIIAGAGPGGGPQIRIFNALGNLINPGFFAYDANFRGGVNVAVGDLNGDKTMEIIAGSGVGGGPHIRVFNDQGKLINPGFFAYSPYFRGGVNVAVGDINGDGVNEIISGAGKGGGPHVKVFDKTGKLITEFHAFSTQSTQGVDVAAYDFDDDRQDEIVALTQDFFVLGL